MTRSKSLPKIIAAYAEAAAAGDFLRAEGWLAVAWLAAGRVRCDHVESQDPRCVVCTVLGPPADPQRDADAELR
jgi:hypothetical protein